MLRLFQGDLIDILRGFNQPRYLDRKPPLADIHLPRGNQQVVADYRIDQLTTGDLIMLKAHRIDGGLYNLLPVTRDIGTENFTDIFNFAL